MKLVAYGDESGIHKVASPCYGIGAFIGPRDLVEDIEEQLALICAEFRLNQELKWSGIAKYRAAIEVSVSGIERAFASGLSFHAIVVEKASFLKWALDPEEAFYTTYYQLARNISRRHGAELDLYIDERSDKYPHRLEVLHEVTNRSLRRIASEGTVASVTKVDSKSSRLLQLSDVLIGAITADTNIYLNAPAYPNAGKLEVIGRLSGLFGWDGLRYDTMPSRHINIWHFPIEFRARPATRKVAPAWLAGGRAR